MIALPENLPTPASTTDLLVSSSPSDSSTPAELERLGDEIARLAAHLHAATYQLLVLIRAFDEKGGWGGGFLSCAHWLSWRTGIGPGPAREKVRVARALATLPKLSGAMAQGELSFSKVRAVTRVATAENEAELLELARHATAAQLERLVRSWRRVDRLQEAEEEKEEEERRHRSRYLRLCPDEDGSYVIRGRLDPEVGALLEKALQWATEELYRVEQEDLEDEGDGAEEAGPASPARRPGSETTTGQRRADALGLVAERALAGPSAQGVGAERPSTGPTGTSSRAHPSRSWSMWKREAPRCWERVG